jgi:membrane-associated protease RseP (regulator of RpoE activity)
MVTDSYDYEVLRNEVGRVFNVESYILGSEKLGYAMRLRGHLKWADSAQAYDTLAQRLEPMGVIPLFQWENEQQSIILIDNPNRATENRPWINLVLFIATISSLLLTGGLYGMETMPTGHPLEIIWAFLQRGWPFALSLILILGAHELGHYFMGKKYNVDVTLPFFIPMPLSPFGTMGAFISMKGPTRNRKALFDIAIAGPLSGLLVAIPVLLIGLSLSTLSPIEAAASANTVVQLEGNSLLYLFAKYLSFGKLLPEPISYNGLTPFVYWIRYFFTGQPLPLGALDVSLHPVAWAGWAGIMVTAMNLIPIGQLDGGHILHTAFGRKYLQRLFPVILVGLGILGLVWRGWWLFGMLMLFFGRFAATPLDQITPLDNRRKWLAILALIIFVLTFTPVPLIAF